MTLALRKSAGLSRKLAGLETELKAWEAESGPKGPLRLHHSQIRRVAGVIRGLGSSIEKARKPTTPSYSDRELEMATLELHRIWEFFRSKFALRKVDWFRGYLAAVDDLAWACYKPARDRAVAAGTIKDADMKEPPLVFLGGGWSPFAMPRRYAYEAELVPDEPLRNTAFIRALESLPVPVVGMPWFQIAHLPDAIVVAHETGHIVEFDFGLSTTLDALVRSAVAASRADAWASWRSETFADTYAIVAVGPAFVGALADVLAVDRQDVVGETVSDPEWGDYPPSYLRMLINFAALRKLKFQEAADKLQEDWERVYGKSHAMKQFEKDVVDLVDKLVSGPYPELGGGLQTVLSFAADLQDEAAVAAERLEDRKQPAAGNVRALMAAGQIAFAAEPATFDDQTQARLIKAIEASRPPGVRGREVVDDAVTEADVRRGEGLLSVLTGH